ncbi:2-phosphosulfolactate phosphatase (plasmid) [Coraliomargarita sp. W4R53]
MQAPKAPESSFTDPRFDQHRYQVRFDWGIDGLARLAASAVVIVVDVLTFSSAATIALDNDNDNTLVLDDDNTLVLDDDTRSDAARAVAAAAAATGSLVLLGSLRNASAVASDALAEQARRGERTSIAVIAVGECDEPGAPLRFAVEDHLGAGAIIDALNAVGIDHTSPEAAVAAEAFSGLRGALRHLITASGSGQELIERGLRDAVLASAEVDVSAAVPVLQRGSFVNRAPLGS